MAKQSLIQEIEDAKATAIGLAKNAIPGAGSKQARWGALQAQAKGNLELAEARVSRLSTRAGRLFSKKSTRVQAMRDLILEQAYSNALALQIEQLEQGAASPNSESEAEEALYTEFSYDKFKTQALLSQRELSSPEGFELLEISDHAQRQLSPESHLTPNQIKAQMTLADNVQKAHKNLTSFKRHFRTKAQNRKAKHDFEIANSAFERLNNLDNQEDFFNPPPNTKKPLSPPEKELQLVQAIIDANAKATQAQDAMLKNSKNPDNQEKIRNAEAFNKAQAEVNALEAELNQFRASLPASSIEPSQVKHLLEGGSLKFSMQHGHSHLLNTTPQGPYNNILVVDVPSNLPKEHLKALEPHLFKQNGKSYLEVDLKTKTISLPHPKKGEYSNKQKKALAEALDMLYTLSKPKTPSITPSYEAHAAKATPAASSPESMAPSEPKPSDSKPPKPPRNR